VNKTCNIVILGSGNLATNLASALKNSGNRIVQIFSRNKANAQRMAMLLGIASFTDSYEEIEKDADIYIIAVSDSSIRDVATSVKHVKGLVVHTAGSIDISVFQDIFTDYGVFYPLQTFSRQRILSFSEIPICLEASSPENMALLKQIANGISSSVHEIDSSQREILHLAAIFVNNFSNHLFYLSSEILRSANISQHLLDQLIKETVDKAISLSPQLAQTGPAVRNNMDVIAKHMELLRRFPDFFGEVYQVLTDSIIQSSHPNNDGNSEF
jgi:predicted short-subunit dehydrogenase-like oxidoreductase (DUF2520 family)